jgi:hypothetical protein
LISICSINKDWRCKSSQCTWTSLFKGDLSKEVIILSLNSCNVTLQDNYLFTQWSVCGI